MPRYMNLGKEDLKEIFTLSPEALLVLDKNFNLIDANKKAIEILELSSITELGNFSLFDPPIQKKLSTLNGDKSFEITYRPKTLNFTCKATKLSGDSFLLLLQRSSVNSEASSLNEKAAQYFKIFTENADDVFWILDKNMKLLYVSPSVTKLRGFTVEEVLAQDINEIIAEDTQNLVYTLFQTTIEKIKKGEKIFQPERMEVKQPCKNGSLVWVEMVISAIFSDKGDFMYFAGISRNISERKTLAKTQNKFNVISDLLPEIVYEIDSGYKFTYMNKAGLKRLNLTLNDISKGVFMYDVVSPNSLKKVNTNLEKYFNGKEVEENEFGMINNLGESFIVQTYNSPILKDNIVVGLQGIAIDITSRKKFEHHLIKAKKKAEESDKLKSTFLANMSHEIRTPMNSILGFSQLLLTPNINEEKKSQYLNIISTNSQLLMNIINDILDISKIESGQVPVVEHEVILNALMKDIHSIGNINLECHNRTNVEIKLHTDLPDDNCKIYADSGKLKQILVNLTTNAIKFTKKGKIEVGYYIKNKELHFYVNDTGIGFRNDQKDIIFERFRQIDASATRELGGTGLGLSICRGLVTLLNGKIWVDSEYGKGSKFQFVIPYKPSINQTKMDAKEDKTDTSEVLANKKVLIVEDDFASYIFLEELLLESGAIILHAENGEEAIQMYNDNPDLDCILMDIQLPSISGIEVTEHIRKLNASVSIIAQTAFAMTEDRKRALNAGCNDYVTKPIDPEILLKKMAYYIQGN